MTMPFTNYYVRFDVSKLAKPGLETPDQCETRERSGLRICIDSALDSECSPLYPRRVSERLRLQAYTSSWTRKLKPPLLLKNGREIVTLNDAIMLISSLPEGAKRTPGWEYVLALVHDAAQHDDSNIDYVRIGLYAALKADRLI